MTSYFELPPQAKAGTANIEALPEEERQQLGRMSLLSPAVTQLLDDLGQDPSDSDSTEGNQSGEESEHLDERRKEQDPGKSHQLKGLHTQPSTRSPLSPKKAEPSSSKKSARTKSPPERSAGGSSKPKQPRMARFHSLRSMLFSNAIEDKIKNITPEVCAKEEEAADKWRSQHAQRQMQTPPKTPEKDAQGKDSKGAGLGSRLKMSIRRMTTKDVTTMETLKEDGAAHDFSDHASTASSDNEVEPYRWKPRQPDEESINHSDVEDLVRWVSRRDPPSDGEGRATGKVSSKNERRDDGYDSMGNSDVDKLVKWVSRKSAVREDDDARSGYSDASTASDSEIPDAHETSDEEEDAEELVRWISHREGPTAGPQRQKKQDISSSIQPRHDSDVPELGDWVKRHGGASDEPGATTAAPDVSDEPERGRPRSRDAPVRPQARTYLTHDDVDELVGWVSKKKSATSPQKQDVEETKVAQEEQAKKQQLGMTVDEGSLSHSDVKDLLEHVKKSKTSLHGANPAVDIASATDTPSKADVVNADQDAKKQHVGMSIDEGSLSHSDVKGLIEHVKTSDLSLHGSSPVVTSSSTNKPETGSLRAVPANEDPAALKHLKEARGEDMEGKGVEKKENARRSSLGHEDVDELVSWISNKKK